MVFCYQNCSDLLWEKKWSSDWEKLLKFEAEGQEFANILRSLEQFISNSERSERCLVTECVFNLFLEVSRSNKLEQLGLKLENNIGIEKHSGKVRKYIFVIKIPNDSCFWNLEWVWISWTNQIRSWCCL